MDNDSNSIHELLELFKHFKTNASDSRQQISSLSFSQKNYDSSKRNPLDSLITMSNHYSTSTHNTSNSRATIFDKLYNESKEMEMRKCRIEYETRKSKEDQQISHCTFSPNICNRSKLRNEYDSIDKNQSFYIKNMQWMERKEKSIKKKQCEKNQGQVNQLTFTPRINKRVCGKENESKLSVVKKKGVNDFLERQEKAKNMKDYVKERKRNPYSHIWNVKKGHFSYVK